MNERDEFAVDDALARKAKQHFDDSVENLDGATRSRLNRGRQAALAELDVRRRRFAQWVPAGGVAAAAVALFVVWSSNPQLETIEAPDVASDMEILLNEDSLEMLEDLEFYSWIDFDAQTDDVMEPANNVG